MKQSAGWREVWRAVLRIGLSVLCAGAFYAGWLGAVLVLGETKSAFAGAVLWLLAPVVTAVGFAVGVSVADGMMRVSRTRFRRIVLWPLIGCIVGAAALYWVGPMLIVFGMFALGTASLVIRETMCLVRSTRGRTPEA